MNARMSWLAMLAAACSDSADRTPVLASATIGPEGGVLFVTAGPQAGLRLTVPPGALAMPTALRILDVTAQPAPGTYPLLGTHLPDPPPPPLPGRPFRIEPEGLRLAEPATLRAPYRLDAMIYTAPGNVRAREVRDGVAIDHEPDVVDVVGAFVELAVGRFGQFLVVRGPIAQTLAPYHQPPDMTVPLADDWTFAVEVVQPPGLGVGIERWRIRGPGREDLLYFTCDGYHYQDTLLGRESVTEDWRETWTAGAAVWTWANRQPPPQASTILTHVQRPMTAPAVDGSITAFGSWWYSEPRHVVDRLLYDVLTLRITLAWSRQDLGVGQREYVFWFAPGIGLLGLAEDGLAHMRTAF